MLDGESEVRERQAELRERLIGLLPQVNAADLIARAGFL